MGDAAVDAAGDRRSERDCEVHILGTPKCMLQRPGSHLQCDCGSMFCPVTRTRPSYKAVGHLEPTESQKSGGSKGFCLGRGHTYNMHISEKQLLRDKLSSQAAVSTLTCPLKHFKINIQNSGTLALNALHFLTHISRLLNLC